MTTRQQLTAMNAPQNLSQREYDRPNMVGNLSLQTPTVQELNAAMSSGGQLPQVESNGPEFAGHERDVPPRA